MLFNKLILRLGWKSTWSSRRYGLLHLGQRTLSLATGGRTLLLLGRNRILCLDGRSFTFRRTRRSRFPCCRLTLCVSRGCISLSLDRRSRLLRFHRSARNRSLLLNRSAFRRPRQSSFLRFRWSSLAASSGSGTLLLDRRSRLLRFHRSARNRSLLLKRSAFRRPRQSSFLRFRWRSLAASSGSGTLLLDRRSRLLRFHKSVRNRSLLLNRSAFRRPRQSSFLRFRWRSLAASSGSSALSLLRRSEPFRFHRSACLLLSCRSALQTRSRAYLTTRRRPTFDRRQG